MQKESVNVEKDKQIQEITNRLQDGIKEVFQSENYKSYLNTISKFHKYSTNNTILINMQKPDATCVAGYKTWKNSFGRQVKAGEKAIKIYAPKPCKKVVEKPILDERGNPRVGLDGEIMKQKVEEYIVANYKVVNVFDISQTEGQELPKLCKQLQGKVDRYADLKEAITRFSPVPIEKMSSNEKGFGYYSNSTKSIGVKEGLSEIHTIKTSIHEISHSILHDIDNGLVKDGDIRTHEVQAESIAYTVCQHYGINTADYSFNYVAAWSSGKELKELKESLDVIQQTSNKIISGIDEKLGEIQYERFKETAQERSEIDLEPRKMEVDKAQEMGLSMGR